MSCLKFKNGPGGSEGAWLQSGKGRQHSSLTGRGSQEWLSSYSRWSHPQARKSRGLCWLLGNSKAQQDVQVLYVLPGYALYILQRLDTHTYSTTQNRAKIWRHLPTVETVPWDSYSQWGFFVGVDRGIPERTNTDTAFVSQAEQLCPLSSSI